MTDQNLSKMLISKRLQTVLNQLERVTIFDKNFKPTLPRKGMEAPHQCEESGKMDKDFPRL